MSDGGGVEHLMAGVGLLPHDWRIDPGTDQGYCERCGEAYRGETNRTLPCAGELVYSTLVHPGGKISAVPNGSGGGPKPGNGDGYPVAVKIGRTPERPATFAPGVETPVEHLQNARALITHYLLAPYPMTQADATELLQVVDRRILKALVGLVK